jgi:hypothetical protein
MSAPEPQGRAKLPRESSGEGAVVAMRVGQEDGVDGPTGNSADQGLKMLVIVGAGIKYGEPILAEKKCVGARESIGACIWGGDASNAIANTDQLPCLGIELLVKDQGCDHCTRIIGGLRK